MEPSQKNEANQILSKQLICKMMVSTTETQRKYQAKWNLSL